MLLLELYFGSAAEFAILDFFFSSYDLTAHIIKYSWFLMELI